MESNNFKEALFKYLCQPQSYRATQTLLSDCSFNQTETELLLCLRVSSHVFSTFMPTFAALIKIIHPSSIGKPLTNALSLSAFSMSYIRQIGSKASLCARCCGFNKNPCFQGESRWGCQASEKKIKIKQLWTFCLQPKDGVFCK